MCTLLWLMCRAPAPSFKPDDELSDVEETAPEKRLRLAKEYLARLQTDDGKYKHVFTVNCLYIRRCVNCV